MALSASRMADEIIKAQEAVEEVQTSDPAAAEASAKAHLVAFCQGLIKELTANGLVVADQGSDHIHTGHIE